MRIKPVVISQVEVRSYDASKHEVSGIVNVG